jgi:class 3 adenylate cyclase
MSSVVVFSGHMIDRPERPVPRFPPDWEGRVAQRIAEELERLDAAHGYASVACGGDILFHEAMLRRGADIHLVLPCNVDEFREVCIDFAPGGDWGRRFEAVLARAASIEFIGEQCASDNAAASECCNRVIVGLGVMQARSKGLPFGALAVWDGRPGDAPGGTHSFVEFCRFHQHPVRVIDTLDVSRSTAGGAAAPLQTAAATNRRQSEQIVSASQRVCGIVFVDAAGFSSLSERRLPAFARHYLGGVNRLLCELENPPLVRNTWGDGLYVVFATVREAGRFALDLQKFVAETDWPAVGLPAELTVRIGLHAGPAYQIYDPVIGQWNYIGAHINRAARIEPVTPLGGILASRVFAALAAAEDVREFECEYAGVVSLPKNSGEIAAYRVVRRKE